MTEPLTPQTAIAYIQRLPLAQEVFGDARLAAEPITEGNVNLLFRVYDQADRQRSILIKQALPYAWRYPDFKMPVDRARIEVGILRIEGRYCPDQVPQVYHYDDENHIMVIEDLNQHLVMREALMQQRRYPRVAQHMGVFMARTLFYTSDLHLASGEKKALVPQFINPVLCKVQEDLVFTQPYIPHPNNRITPPLKPLVEERVYADDDLRADIFHFKERYMTHAQALIHNDLHTGSIMLNQEETKVIDPEFGFFGPMGHDIGTYFANLALSYASQEAHAPDETVRASYRGWLLQQIRETWRVFEREFLTLWEEEGNEDWPSDRFKQRYMAQLLQDTAGFGAAEMMRRLIGMAHVHDFWTIEDKMLRARAESLGLDIALRWIKNRHDIHRIDDLTQLAADARPLLL